MEFTQFTDTRGFYHMSTTIPVITSGLVHIVLMEDEIIHTDTYPFCSDVTSWCPCHDDHQLVERFLMRPMASHVINGCEAMKLYWGTATPDEARAIVARITQSEVR
jgi:hypothetical protein